MSEPVSRREPAPGSPASSLAEVDSLVSALSSPDGSARQDARLSLVRIGKPAVPTLMQALASRNWHTRWEAAKALSSIGDPAAAPALIRALEQEERFGVRWLAAEGLIALGDDAVPPLLQALIDRPYSPWLREGAHHVLRLLADAGLRQEVARVISALEDVEPELRVPIAARSVLGEIERERRQRQPRR